MNDAQLAAGNAALTAWAAPLVAGSAAKAGFFHDHANELVTAIGNAAPDQRDAAVEAWAAPYIAHESIWVRGFYKGFLEEHKAGLIAAVGPAIDAAATQTDAGADPNKAAGEGT